MSHVFFITIGWVHGSDPWTNQAQAQKEELEDALTLRTSSVDSLLQIKCKHPIERESNDQILEIEPYHIKST